MKKKEIAVVVALIFFGWIYHTVEKADFGFLNDLSFSVDGTRLWTDQYSEFIQKEMRFAAIQKIVLDNPAGGVKIQRATDDQALIRPLIRVYHDQKVDAEKLLRQIRIETKVENQELKISVQQPNFPYHRVRIFFVLAVPENTQLDVRNRYGNVDIQGAGKKISVDETYGDAVIGDIDSTVDVSCKYGDLQVRNIKGKAFLETRYTNIQAENIGGIEIDAKYESAVVRDIRGPAKIRYDYGTLALFGAESAEIYTKHTKLTAKNVKHESKIRNSFESVWLENLFGDIHLSTKNCKINLLNCRSDSLVIENSFDNVKIQGFSGLSIDVSLQHGEIALDFVEVKDKINLDCRYGNIVLAIPFGCSPSFNLKTKYGEIIHPSDMEIPISQDGIEKYVNLVGKKPGIMINNVYGDIELKHK